MLAVVGGKGGTGKTTTSLGLARAVAGRARRPLIVEADVDMPDLAIVCSIPHAPGIAALSDGESLSRVSHRPVGLDSVDVVPAAPGASLTSALDGVPRDRPVILDCGPGAAPDVAAALRAADAALLVTRPNRTAVADAHKTAAMARRLDAPVVGIVATCARSVPEALAQSVHASTAVAVPRARGPPLESATVQAAYRRLAAELRKRGVFPGSAKR